MIAETEVEKPQVDADHARAIALLRELHELRLKYRIPLARIQQIEAELRGR